MDFAVTGKKYDVIIIGGGVIGCAIARALAKYELSIALLERNPDVAMGTSGKNSAVVHAGFNNRPGSLMAKYCVEGNKMFADLCAELDVPFRRTGKLVVALDDDDIGILEGLIEDGNKNGCIGLSLVNRAEMDALEPLAAGVGAMYSSNTGVVNPFLYNMNLAYTAIKNGVRFYLEHGVTEIEKKGDSFFITAAQTCFECKYLINSAGLYSDEIAAMAGDSSYRIYPARGQYYILDKQASKLVGMPIYPAPRKGVGGLGIHLTTTIDDNMILGPSAEYVDSKEEYATTADVLEQLFREAKMLLPQLDRNLIIGAYTGIRSKIVAKGQENFGDFIIEESIEVPGLISLIGIESPGLTASVPIANRVTEMIREKMNPSEKPGYDPRYTRKPLFRELSEQEQHERIRENPDYGEVICRCELVTKGDVVDALCNPLGARSMVSIKNRVRAMMGRCQGGYCFTRLVDILSDEGNPEPEKIIYRVRGDRLFEGRVK